MANEQAVAEVVAAWLEAAGADVYQEVVVSGGVADIVARVGVEIWIIEVKTSLSLALLVQAMDRRRLAHRIYIAAPTTRTMRDVEPLCKELGVGLLEVRTGNFEDRYEFYQPKVTERTRSRRWNRRPVELAGKLKPEHKTHAKAGAVGAGGRWTPWRNTIEQLARAVRAEPGIVLKAAIAEIDHHYSSAACARSSLAKWIAEGSIPGVTARREAGVLRLYPAEAA
jgi:hypothetical protein